MENISKFIVLFLCASAYELWLSATEGRSSGSYDLAFHNFHNLRQQTASDNLSFHVLYGLY